MRTQTFGQQHQSDALVSETLSPVASSASGVRRGWGRAGAVLAASAFALVASAGMGFVGSPAQAAPSTQAAPSVCAYTILPAPLGSNSFCTG